MTSATDAHAGTDAAASHATPATTDSSSSSSTKPIPVATADDDDELEEAPEAIYMTADEEMGAATSKDTSESGKIKTLLGLLRRMIGVKDMSSMRLSLPANMLEPVPNLEYWNYLDRGDLFTIIPEFEDDLDRFLAVLRFTFTKELKFVTGKLCKPYNSILGEHFRCHWDVEQPQINADGTLLLRQSIQPDAQPLITLAGKAAAETAAEGDEAAAAKKTATAKRGGLSKFLGGGGSKNKVPTLGSGDSEDGQTPATTPKPDEDGFPAASSRAASTKSVNDEAAVAPGPVKRVTFLTEQVSHHPPISSFFVECKDAGLTLCGVDQLAAKFTGTSVRISPGDQNKGIFLNLTDAAKHGKGEEYQITHPSASVNGVLRGSLWAAVCDTAYVTCRGTKDDGKGSQRLRAIIEYKDEGWLGKPKFAMEGVIYECDVDDYVDMEYTKCRDVPQEQVVATIEGCWKNKIWWKRKGDKDLSLLVNLEDLSPIEKGVRPLAAQEPFESRKIWEPVTSAILAKDFGPATKAKLDIEAMQRKMAAQRKKKGEEFMPKFFEKDISDGRPKLNDAGRAALDGEHELAGYDTK